MEITVARASQLNCSPAVVRAAPRSRTVFWLQGVTVAWMLVECGISCFAAYSDRSPALLAFGSDSVVELLSASVVLYAWWQGAAAPEEKTARIAGVLLFALAGLVTAIAALSLLFNLRPETSPLGIAITVAALIAMPVLSRLKRREARRTGNRALAADAVQSATCAYLALLTLVGLALNAALHVTWVDPLAALLAVPLLAREGRSAWRGQGCGCS